MALSSGVCRTTFSSILTQAVDRDHFARVLGLSDMVMALNRALGPAVSGFAISYGGSEFACAVRYAHLACSRVGVPLP